MVAKEIVQFRRRNVKFFRQGKRAFDSSRRTRNTIYHPLEKDQIAVAAVKPVGATNLTRAETGGFRRRLGREQLKFF